MNPYLHSIYKPSEREEDVAFSVMLFPCVSKLTFTLFWSKFQRKKKLSRQSFVMQVLNA